MKIDKPLLFDPLPQHRIWGGEKLCGTFFKKFPDKVSVGESWELGFMPGFDSVVQRSVETLGSLLMSNPLDILGQKILDRYKSKIFPLLVKFIDAKEKLSVQVHPGDDLAKLRHKSLGKSEMWYVVDAVPDAKIIAGFKPGITKSIYLEMLQNGDLIDTLQYFSVAKGDAIYIPSGLVHAIGEGVLLLEVQQASDITYRIYDWDRVDTLGNPRELHTALSLDAISFSAQPYRISASDYNGADDTWISVLSTPYFNFSILDITRESVSCVAQKSFTIYICIEGEISVSKPESEVIVLSSGVTLLIPYEYGKHEVSVVSGPARLLKFCMGDEGSDDLLYKCIAK